MPIIKAITLTCSRDIANMSHNIRFFMSFSSLVFHKRSFLVSVVSIIREGVILWI